MRLGTRMLLVLACAAAARGELVVSSHNADAVLRYDATNGALLGTFIAAGSGGLSAPHEPVFGPDGDLYVASAGNDRILAYDGASGAFRGTFVAAGSGGLDYPAAMLFAADGRLYVSSQLNDRILRYDGASGAFLDTFVAAGSGGLDGPSGLAFGPDGNLYVSGRFTNLVFRYSGVDGSFLGAFGSNQLSQPFGLAFGADGLLYVASGNANGVARFDPTNGAHLGVFTSGGNLSLPIGLAFDPDGDLYVASFINSKVARFSAADGATLGDFVAPGAGGLNGANFLAFRPARPADPGAVYFGVNQNGAYDYGRQTNLPPGFGRAEFTLELWARPDNTFPTGSVATLGGALTNWSDGDNEPYSAGDWWYAGNFLLDGHNNNSSADGTFSVQFHGNGRVRWDFGDGAPGLPGGHWAVQAWPATNAPSLLDGAWHHLALVRRWVDPSDARLELWIDGLLRAAETSNVRTDLEVAYWNGWTGFPGGQEGWFWGAEKQVAVGAYPNPIEDYKGLLDEVRFWDHARAPAALAEGGRAPVTGAETGLVGWIDFSRWAGTNALDRLDTNRTITFTRLAAGVFAEQNAPFDLDGDGLPDWWEHRHFGTGTNAAADADDDADDTSNVEEYECGTDPTNSASRLAVTGLDAGVDAAALHWISVGGRRYRIEFSDEPGAPVQAPARDWAEETEQGVGLDAETTRVQALPETTNEARVFRLRRLAAGP